MLKISMVACVALVLLGCGATVFVKLEKPEEQAAPPSALIAGAAKSDITPPPGYPMGGYGPIGQISRGAWTRLNVRAVYFEDRNGQSLLMVSADLWSMPAMLANKVAEIVNARFGHISREEMIIAASHTHHSPGNFSSNPAYNELGSPQAGFDPDMFAFLAKRISDAAIEAVIDARRGSKENFAELSFARTEPISRFFRNRSFEPFKLNRGYQQILRQNQNLTRGDKHKYFPDPYNYHAVDPVVRILTVRSSSSDRRIIATLVFLAVHPTVMGPTLQLYNSDILGIASHLLEDGSSPGAPVLIFNGAEGDISADWIEQDKPNALRLGRTLAEKIDDGIAVANSPDRATRINTLVDIGISYDNFLIAGANVECCMQQGSVNESETRKTAEEAIPGVAVLAGGADGGRTLFHELGWIDGVTSRRQWGRNYRGQGPKQPAFAPTIDSLSWLDLTRLLLPGGVQKKTPLGVYRLGDLTFVTVPFEVTTMMGRRLKNEVTEKLGLDSDEKVLLIGLANDYLSYVTTSEEYEAQHYEGALTLYGAATGPLIQERLGKLATADGRGMRLQAQDRDLIYKPGECERFGPDNIGEPPYFPDDGLGKLLFTHDGKPQRARYVVKWRAPYKRIKGLSCTVRTGSESIKKGQLIDYMFPEVEILYQNGASWETYYSADDKLQNNHGFNFVTLMRKLDKKSKTQEWVAIWMPPADLRPGTRLTFRVKYRNPGGNTLKTVCSKNFVYSEHEFFAPFEATENQCP